MMPEPQYSPPDVPNTVTERDKPTWLDGHRVGWTDAANNNLGHGTEPPEKINGEYYAERVWFDGWDAGVTDHRAAAMG